MSERYAKSKMGDNAWDTGRIKQAFLLAFLVVLTASALSAQSLSTALAGYWRFNGDGTDSSGNGRDLTLVGSPTFAQGKFGQALSLDGSGNQYAIRGADDSAFDFGAGDFTVQIWANFNTEPNEQTLIEKFTGAGGPGWTFTTPGGKALQFYSTSNVVNETLSISTGTWYHFVARNSSGILTLFVNGSPIASGNIGSIPASSNPLLIGRRNNGDTRIFAVNGLVEDAAIWTRGLSDSEVSSLYQQELMVNSGTPASPTVLDDVTAASSGIVSYPDGAAYCQTPTSVQTFTLASPAVYLYFDVNGAAVGDSPTANFYRPDGTLFQSYTWNPLAQVGTNGYSCFSDALNVSGTSAASYPGVWTAKVFWDQSATPLFTLTFTIVNSNQPAPSINYRGVANAALSGAGASVAAGSIIEVYGSNLTSGNGGSAPSFPLPTTLFGSQVLMNSIAAPLLFASSNQINAQVPWEVRGASTLSVQVMSDGVGSNTSAISMAETGPGIFVIVHAADSSLITDAKPAVPGEYLLIYCTGLGAVTNQPADGAAALGSPLSRTIANTTVTIGGVSALVAFSGLSPGFAGLYQVNVQVPAGTPGGSNVNLTLQAGSNSTDTTITVQASGTPGIVVTIAPSIAIVQTGGTQQFTATVTGATNAAVTWSVNSIVGGNSVFGTISTAGLYTAPPNVPNPNPFTITGVSVQNSSVSDSSTVTIIPAQSPVISSLSSSTLIPLEILTITGSGFDSSAVVEFSSTLDGITIPVPALVVSSTSLLVAIPPLFNGSTPITGAIGVAVQQSGGRSGAATISIAPLPAPPPSAPGTLTVGFLQGVVETAMDLSANPAAASLSSDFNSVISNLSALIQALQPLQSGVVASISLPASNGGVIIVTSADLTRSDQLLLAMMQSLSQTTSDLVADAATPKSQSLTSGASAPGCPSAFTALTTSIVQALKTLALPPAAIAALAKNMTAAVASDPRYLKGALIGFSLMLTATEVLPPLVAAVELAPEGVQFFILEAKIASTSWTFTSALTNPPSTPATGALTAINLEQVATRLLIAGLAKNITPTAKIVINILPATVDIVKSAYEILDSPPSSVNSPSAGVACFSSTILNFGSANTGSSASQPVTLSNGGSGNLSISAISLGSTSAQDRVAPWQVRSAAVMGRDVAGAFSDSTNCPVEPQTLAPGSSCTITAGFSPSTATLGPQNASVLVSGTSAGLPQTVNLFGVGTNTGNQSYGLTVAISGTGSGTVSPSPAGTSCGANCFSYAAGTAVTVTATPSSGSTFTGWSGACSGTGACSLVMNSNFSVTATFAHLQAPYTLTTSTSGTGSGSVTPSPLGTSCGGGCWTYLGGTIVTLTATPNSGSTFAGWAGACSGTGSCTVTMNSNQSVTATFSQSGPAGSETWTGTVQGTILSGQPYGCASGGSWGLNFTISLTVTSSLVAAVQSGGIGTNGSGSAYGTETVGTQAPPDGSGCQLLPTTIPDTSPVSFSVAVLPPSSGSPALIQIYQLSDQETLLCTTTGGCQGNFYFNVQPTTISSTVISGVSSADDQAQGFQVTFTLTKQ